MSERVNHSQAEDVLTEALLQQFLVHQAEEGDQAEATQTNEDLPQNKNAIATPRGTTGLMWPQGFQGQL